MFIETAFAETSMESSIFWQAMSLDELLLLIVSLIVIFAAVATVIFILWWWVLVILSWGKDDKIKPAINTIRYAFFWLVVIVATLFIFPIFWKLLWLDFKPFLDTGAIFNKIGELTEKLFWSPSSSSDYNNYDPIRNDIDFINEL